MNVCMGRLNMHICVTFVLCALCHPMVGHPVVCVKQAVHVAEGEG